MARRCQIPVVLRDAIQEPGDEGGELRVLPPRAPPLAGQTLGAPGTAVDPRADRLGPGSAGPVPGVVGGYRRRVRLNHPAASARICSSSRSSRRHFRRSRSKRSTSMTLVTASRTTAWSTSGSNASSS